MQPNPIFVPMTVSVDSVEIGMSVDSNTINLPVTTDTKIVVENHDTPPYEGEYTVTPSLEQQVLETNGYRMTDDVTVEAMPVGSFGDSDINKEFVTQDGQLKLKQTAWTEIYPAGYMAQQEHTLVTKYMEAIPENTVITPSMEQQTIGYSNRNTVLQGKVIIAPIPSDYGKITWNGSVLTVS